MKQNDKIATVGDVKKITKDVVTKIVIEASHAMLTGVQKMFDNQNKLNDKKFATKKELKEFRKEVKTEFTFVKRDISDIKADLSDTPSRKQFNKLEDKVDRFIAAS